MDAAACLTSKGPITIPKVVREALGLVEGDQVVFRVGPPPRGAGAYTRPARTRGHRQRASRNAWRRLGQSSPAYAGSASRGPLSERVRRYEHPHPSSPAMGRTRLHEPPGSSQRSRSSSSSISWSPRPSPHWSRSPRSSALRWPRCCEQSSRSRDRRARCKPAPSGTGGLRGRSARFSWRHISSQARRRRE